MNTNKLQLGIIGLGKMGGNLAAQALEKGMRVVGLTKGDPPDHLLKEGLIHAKNPEYFLNHLDSPRVIMIYIHSGPAIDKLINELAEVLEEGDIMLDGGNSYWGDSISRYERLKEKGIQFIDLGTSGGIEGARDGACFMAGGENTAIKKAEPVLKELSVEGGYVHAGPPGAGHFVKLVHNGIEFGMLQAIGEGMDLLTNYKDKLDIADVLHCWRNGSVIRSWLMDLLEKVYREEGSMEKVPSYVEDTGEVNWLVDDAMHMEVPVHVIAQSVMQLFASRDENSKQSRAIAMMRHGFGGHPYGPDKSIREGRKKGRVGGFYSE
ncbi:MAG: decarboxylating 6-phosphogluconate dehydrogenase [Bacteroidales bacterium]|nr:decarboxylating 6-phosphogluconate dehydrogenase [Bacteroidales bacterium]MCF8344504.1 decarboxylating 6-phosphogluconate dehydrogenase [Bacteroidales bacterium]MCF8352014.1 decarboxylating 6-phosphogluconate dehydrogenase [Bacteroidales bacterium]MCF8377616.1 decarboxylating 6-phosphogluconate dehydrogenase [Bacteroidales bacterium]